MSAVSKIVMLTFFCFLPSAGFSEDGEKSDLDIKEKIQENLSMLEQELDPREWGIRSGCINKNRIRNIRFIDDQYAVLKTLGRKKVLLTMKKECRGIKRNGYIMRVRGHQLCAKFDRLEVMDVGISCAIESLEPYVEPTEDDNLG